MTFQKSFWIHYNGGTENFRNKQFARQQRRCNGKGFGL